LSLGANLSHRLSLIWSDRL